MIFIFLIYYQVLACPFEELKSKSILRGNYKDIIQYQQKSLILNDNVYYAGGLLNSYLNRDSIYYVDPVMGYTYCIPFHSITFQLSNFYEINTVVVEIWDRLNSAVYSLEIYISQQDQETKIYDNVAISGFVKIQFKDQLVNKIKIYNSSASGQNFSIIKAQAFYSIHFLSNIY